MNTIKLNTIGILSGGGNAGGGGGGVTINNQEKSVDITENGTTEVVADAGFTGLSKVVVNTNVASSGGNTPAPSGGAVNFKDYDGTILHSYTKDAFLALAEMPTLPTRQGLTCQGWNWALEDAKAYVTENGKLDVGATYITDDGKTRLYIKVEGERKEFPFKFSIDKVNSLVIDWGDGVTESVSGSGSLNVSHTYDAVGDYVISLEVAEGAKLTFANSSSESIVSKPYSVMLRKVEFGEAVVIGSYAFNACYSLSSVVISNSVTYIDGYAFRYCYSLSSVVIPNSVTHIDGSAFQSCMSLSSVVIPNSVVYLGGYAFNACYSLSSVVIPNRVTKISSRAFQSCSSVAYFDFRQHTSVPTLSNTSAFTSIASDCKIVVPDALYDEWIAATNWSTYASNIVKASEFNG